MTEPCLHPDAEVFGAYRSGALAAWCRACGQRWTDPETAPVEVVARIYERMRAEQDV